MYSILWLSNLLKSWDGFIKDALKYWVPILSPWLGDKAGYGVGLSYTGPPAYVAWRATRCHSHSHPQVSMSSTVHLIPLRIPLINPPLISSLFLTMLALAVTVENHDVYNLIPNSQIILNVGFAVYTFFWNLFYAEAESKEKYGVRDPMPELTITSPYVHSRVDSNTFYHGQPYARVHLILYQGRLYTPERDFGFGLW